MFGSRIQPRPEPDGDAQHFHQLGQKRSDGIPGIKKLVDLVGIEPTTSSMPFLILDCSRATTTARE
jgi:hypothetical protein